MATQIKLSTQEGEETKVYHGRFLGFIKDDEFNALVEKTSDVANRLESKATQPLMTVIAKFDNMSGYRLIMTVLKIGHVVCGIKKLYITEPLELVSSTSTSTKKITLQTKEHDVIEVQETD